MILFWTLFTIYFIVVVFFLVRVPLAKSSSARAIALWHGVITTLVAGLFFMFLSLRAESYAGIAETSARGQVLSDGVAYKLTVVFLMLICAVQVVLATIFTLVGSSRDRSHQVVPALVSGNQAQRADSWSDFGGFMKHLKFTVATFAIAVGARKIWQKIRSRRKR